MQRRAGVSPAAAYRHYRDRDALMVAVGQRASAVMADTIQRALDAAPSRAEEDSAVPRLRAGIAAYLEFAREEPGLFRALFLTDEDPAGLENPEAPSRGGGGVGPYEILLECLADLIAEGGLPEANAPWSDTAVWAASHGLAVLFLDGPLRYLDGEQRQAAEDRLLDLIIDGLAGRAP